MKKLLCVLALILLTLLLAAATGGEPSEKPVEVFIPSEQIRADSAVSFPVDI